MNEEITEYIKDGINIRKYNDGSYEVFTTITQRFMISSLKELTAERFEQAIKDLEKRNKLEYNLTELLYN